MRLSRREFLKAAAAAVAAGRLAPTAFAGLTSAMRGDADPRVIWLQGAGCDGCAISFLNSVHYAEVDDLLINTIDLEFQSNLMAATGDLAVSIAENARVQPGYILVVEGAIPTGDSGRYCMLWGNTTMQQGLLQYAVNASFVVALGACASYGGVTGGLPNPTDAGGVQDIIGEDSRLVNIPGCPAHPDWLVGTLSYIILNGHLPPLDQYRRPLEYFGRKIHDNCFKRGRHCGQDVFASKLGEEGCMELLGCKGKKSYADCYMRKWNSEEQGRYGVNWCVGSKSPCLGCVQPDFPDGMSPFYVHSPSRNGNS